MSGMAKASATRWAVWTAALFVCLPAVALLAQRPGGGHRETPPQRFSAPRVQAPRQSGNREVQGRSQGYNRPENYNRPQERSQGYGRFPQQEPQYRGQRGPYPGSQARPQAYPQYRQQTSPYSRQFQAAPQPGNSRRAGNVPSSERPAQSTYPSGSAARPPYTPASPLGSWLNQHRNATPQAQQRMLQNDPSFRRLPESTQQRLMRQLNRVDQMPEAQRERRLARAQNLGRLSPAERAQVTDSARRWTALPADRQAMMKSAFRDLRSVPPDQRQTVLNSNRYQNVFSPDERNILSNMLRVEPYEPPR